MPDRLETPIVTCPPNTPETAPVEVPLPFSGGIVRAVHVVIPAGHAGLTGIALGFGHQPVIPYTVGTFISGDDDVIHFPYNDKNAGVQWSAFVCNGDLEPHSWQVRFELDEVTAPTTPVATAPISVSDIVAAGNAALSESSPDATS